jgi:hypothetical protein
MEPKNADRPGWAQMTRRVCRWTGALIPGFHRTFGQSCPRAGNGQDGAHVLISPLNPSRLIQRYK